MTDDELIQLIDCEIELRAAAGQSVDHFEYRNRFPAQLVAIQSAFSRLKGFEDLVTRTDLLNATGFDGSAFELERPGSDTIPAQLGDFKIGKKLGSGAFGIVHLAEDTSTGQQLALKFPRRQHIRTPEELEVFRSEAEAAQGLRHPGIVTTHGVFEISGYIFIAQQYVPGGSLSSLRNNTISQRRLAGIIADVSEALAYAHQQGITHRDLKPSNIMLDNDGNPLIVDFGLAVHESAQRRLKGQRCGTPAYMSPEQVNGLAHLLDGRSDIWSLGVILYELLVGRRPFDGNFRHELFEEITERDPKPPRMIRPQVDRELQRICLKCLYKPIRERYHTADELSQDLRAWLEGRSAESKRSVIPVVPQGLRSFGPHDSDFYQRLLPGPKDQQGLAESTRFWKSQIETSGGQTGFRVGVIIGPSGCGKSSYIKAGLLPFLDARKVESIFVEATSLDTETRLRQRLQARFPDLAHDAELPQLVDQVREDLRTSGDRKLLIVIDQFEQWLHAQQAFEKTELLQALLHSDGANLQCILLVRDDFWLRTSQFLHAMEIDFREGTNARRIDLFERRHAARVLHEFGHAFGKLSDLDEELNADQTTFLEQAIESIAEEERVVCVRLALFAEMFRNRPWTVAELEKVGGASGIGETFLNETFASADADLFFRRNEQPVRRILSGLLPKAGENIRAHMRTHEYLLSKSQLSAAPFDELMNRLDNELRLVTPTDPNASAEIGNPAQSETSRHYQLTHDYLVPSIRDWLNKEQKRTKRGRAELRLNELSEYWSQKQDRNFLPGWLEYAAIRWRVSRKSWTQRQRLFMRKAGRIHLFRGVLMVLILCSLAWLGYVLNHQFQARAIHDELLSSSISQVPEIAGKMKSIGGWVEPLLEESRNKIESQLQSDSSATMSEQDHERLLRLEMASVYLAGENAETQQVKNLKQHLIEAEPDQIAVIRQFLYPHQEQVNAELWEQVENPDANILQAAAGLAHLDPDNERWEKCRMDVASRLVRIPTTHFPIWVSLFEPVQHILLPELTAINADPGRTSAEQRLALDFIVEYRKNTSTYLIKAIEHADRDGFNAIIEVLREKKVSAELLEPGLNISALPNWQNSLTLRPVPELPPALHAAFADAGGQLQSAFAFCVAMPRDTFSDVCEQLKVFGYRADSVRVGNVTSGIEFLSCVWVRDELKSETQFGTAAEIRAIHKSMEDRGLQAVDIDCYAINDAGNKVMPGGTQATRYCLTWREPKDGFASYARFELTDEQWNTVAESIALTGFERLERRSVIQVDGNRLMSGIWSKSDSRTLTFDSLSPRDPAFVGQLQLDRREDDSQIWADSSEMESRIVSCPDVRSHLDESVRLIEDGYRPHLVGFNDIHCNESTGNADDEMNVCSIWHRPLITENEKERAAKRRANLTLAVLALHPDSEAAWKEFEWRPDPRTRSYLIHRFHEYGLAAGTIFRRLQNEQNPTIQRAQLLALGEYELSELGDLNPQTINDFVFSEFMTHADSGIHYAAAWLLKRMGRDQQLQEGCESLKLSSGEMLAIHADDPRRWYVSPMNHQMTIIKGETFLMGSPPSDPDIGEDEVLQWKQIDRTFAMSVHEMTREKYLPFVRATEAKDMVNRPELRFEAPTMDCPITGMDFYEAAAYCNWLSEQEGVPVDQWCYEPNSDGKYASGMQAKPDFLSRTGYRLPTLAEWEFACRAGAVTPRCFGQSDELLKNYAWFNENANRRTWPVGSLKPNEFGLFDMHGNQWEWCQDVVLNYETFLDEEASTGLLIVDGGGREGRSMRGGCFKEPAHIVRSADRNGIQAETRGTDYTFRICRTIPD